MDALDKNIKENTHVPSAHTHISLLAKQFILYKNKNNLRETLQTTMTQLGRYINIAYNELYIYIFLTFVNIGVSSRTL